MLSIRRFEYRAAFVASLAVVPSFAWAGSYNYTTIGAPQNDNVAVFAVSKTDMVGGSYFDANGLYHNFVLARKVRFDPGFRITSFNANSVAVGNSTKFSGPTTAYIDNFETGHRHQLYIAPAPVNVTASSINLSNMVAGWISPGGGSGDQIVKGFLKEGHAITFITGPSSPQTHVYAISDKGAATGNYVDSKSFNQHGFVFESGHFSTFDPPNSLQTVPSVITKTGVIAGSYMDSHRRHGFIREGGAFTIIDYPGATNTSVVGTGLHGEVYGNWYVSNLGTHGFVLVEGVYHPIIVPSETPNEYTLITAVNASGSMAGVYYDSARGAASGFLAVCSAAQRPCVQ